MARLIYLEDAIEKIVNFPSKVAHDAFYGRKQFTPLEMLTVIADRQHEVINLLKTIKEVDAVEVVRCRDCKKWHPDIGWCDEHSCFIDSDGNFCHPHESSNWKMFDADYFCKDGERKTDEQK